jgi:hypothetical protein
MSSPRALLDRVRKLEVADVNPILKKIGSMEKLEQVVAEHVAAKRMCPVDGPFIVECVRRWATGTYHYRAGIVSESFALEQHTS